MVFEFKLPDLGEGTSEGEIVRWLVQVGDVVAAEQPLVEVMTDKVTAELPSPVAGKVVRLVGQPGGVVPVHSPLVCIETEDHGALPESMAAPATASSGSGNGARLAVPAIRRLARELSVDLQRIVGTGPGGRILEADVRAAAGASSVVSPGAPELRTAPDGARDEHPGRLETGVQRRPLRGVRRAIAGHLLDAHRNTAPYTLVEEIDFTELVGIRERVQPLAERAGVRLTYLSVVLAAVSKTLREHPELNATVDPENGDLLVHAEQHLSVAVHTAEGLQTPVIRNVERRSLLDLAREVERLKTAARGGSLSKDDVRGGTFTVSNLGTRGGIMGTPMLNVPQVAILGIHRIEPRPAVRGGEIVPRQMANVSLTLDHRYIDGYVGGAFTASLKSCLEDPAVLLFWLAELREER